MGGKVEGKRDDGKLALMVERESRGSWLETGEGAERHLLAGGGADVNTLERIRVLLELRIDFEDDVILVELRKNRGDLTLAEGVVERVVNVGGKNSEARGGV